MQLDAYETERHQQEGDLEQEEDKEVGQEQLGSTIPLHESQ